MTTNTTVAERCPACGGACVDLDRGVACERCAGTGVAQAATIKLDQKVARIYAEIQQGCYLHDDKLDIAVAVLAAKLEMERQ